MVMGEKRERQRSVGGGGAGSGMGVLAEELLHFSGVKEDEILSEGLSSLLMVENRVRGFEDPEWMMPE